MVTRFTLKGFLFRRVKLAKNTDPNDYVYTGYAIAFDSRSVFSLPDGSMRKNAIILIIRKNIDNKEKYILVLREGPTQELDYTTLAAEVKYPINFTQLGKMFVLSIHYSKSNSLLFVNATKMYQYKTLK